MERRIPVGLAAATICALFLCNAAPLKGDTVTLNSGDVLEGKIISENDTQVEMQVSMYHGSIISTRELLKSDIKSVSRETEEQRQEKAAYEVISRYVLNPNQEYKPDQYALGISAFQKFLAKYPNSDHADDVRSQIVAWKAEAENVTSGKVKFNDQWMTPDEKQPLVEQWQKQNAVRMAENVLQTLKTQLSSLQTQRQKAVDNFQIAQGQLGSAQGQLATIQDTAVPVTATTGGGGYFAHNANNIPYWVPTSQQSQRVLGYQTIQNPDRVKVSSEVSMLQAQLGSGQQAIADVDRKIADVNSEIAMAEHQYQSAVIKSQEPPTKIVKAEPASVVVVPPPPPPPVAVAPPPPPEPLPWYKRLWNWL